MRVLVAEDELVSRDLLQRLLRSWGYDVVVCSDGSTAAEHLCGLDPPRLGILDWLMPGLEGPEVCQTVRDHARISNSPYVYLMLLTARDRKTDLLAGLASGADDFLTKPCAHEELRARLRCGERIVELEARLRAAQDDLRRQARRDHLTGLMNRGAILEELGREAARAERDATSLGVVLLDLDWFKLVNDEHGHAAGDAVLAEAARRMATGLRVYDHLGRWGGEEFLVVTPRCGPSATRVVAERMRQAVAASTIAIPGGAVDVTVSAGLVATIPGGARDAAALVQAADRALYRAKASGRNRVEEATEGDLGEADPVVQRGAA